MIKNVQQDGDLFIAEAKDMVTKEDIESLIPMAEEMISQYGKIKCLVIINEMKGYSVDGFLADFGFYFKHKDNFSYMAIVGDKKLEKAMNVFLTMFFKDKAKYFETSDLDKAKEWIKQV